MGSGSRVPSSPAHQTRPHLSVTPPPLCLGNTTGTVALSAQFVVVLLSRVLCGRFLFRLLLSHHQLKQSTMARPAATKVASLVALAASSALVATAHPLCFYGPDRAVSTTVEATFCPDDQSEGFCCEPDEEAALVTKYEAERMSAECAPLYKEVGERKRVQRVCAAVLVSTQPVSCFVEFFLHKAVLLPWRKDRV